jgi:DnaJ-class molecular chaperone
MRVKTIPHPLFERKGEDLQVPVTVPLTTAVLGGEVQVPTLDGPVGIKVPPGSRPGRLFRLRNHGLPRLEAGGGRGDLLASLSVDLPASVGDRERELFEELKKLGH